MRKITIAIDGFSSTGKSTLAKQLAHELKYVYVDTGAMYRAVTLFAMQQDYIGEEHFNIDLLKEHLNAIKIHFVYNKDKGFAEVYLNDKNVESEIRKLEVSQLVSQVSTIAEVRVKLVEQQQEMGKDGGIVMDGRDIGTVVFPNAELKIFMTASADIRARRRYDEMIEKGDCVTFDSVLENVTTRDYLDTTRKDSPLVKAFDAVEINSDHLNVQETFDLVYKKAMEKINSLG